VDPVIAAGARHETGGRAMLIPAYVPPAGVIDLVQDAPRAGLVVINPHNGPGAGPRPSYREAVRVAHDAGTRVLGYVATGWGARPAAAVRADIDRHRWWYRTDGVFLDEVAPDAGRLAQYAALCRHARDAGCRLVALNPGVVPARGLFDVADVVVTFEGPAEDHPAALAHLPVLPRARVAHLVHGATREQALAAARAPGGPGYLYATSGRPPNPWRTLPSYLDEQDRVLRA
jgi:hypothetical protein